MTIKKIITRLLAPTLLIHAALLLATHAMASDTLKLHKITPGVHAIVGELSNRSPENLANNATFGLVETSKGMVLIDSGGTYDGAKAIDRIIKTITDKPVVLVINSGGQDHRWLGNGYFAEQGAQIIASEAAVADHKDRGETQLAILANLVGQQQVDSTKPVYADTTFSTKKEITLGDTQLLIQHTGGAHTPGDSFVWLPEQSVVFTGDVVYVERMLGVIEVSNSKNWVTAFEAIASLNPSHVVPGHGQPTTLERAQQDTYTYLMFLRKQVATFMDAGKSITRISTIDQSAFNYLKNFENLAGRNAQQVYTEMEWE